MADAGMALLELIEKGADADLVHEMLAFAARRLMDAEVQARTGAAHGARDPERLVQRNGDRERAWDTRAGQFDLKIPRLRRGSYFPSFLEPRRPAGKALTAVIQEAWVHGVPMRAEGDLVKAMGASGVSKSQVSRLVAEIDATDAKGRKADGIVSTATIIAVGVHTDGRREVAGVATGPSEAEVFCKASCVCSPVAASAASSSSSPTTIRDCGRPHRRSSTPACSDAGSRVGREAPLHEP